MASVLLSTKDAVTLTAVSGSDVPIATIVNPIIMDGTASFFATLELPSTKKSAPFTKSANPTTRSRITTKSGALLMKSPIISSFFIPPDTLLTNKKDPCMRTLKKRIHESHSLRFARRNAEVVDKPRLSRTTPSRNIILFLNC